VTPLDRIDSVINDAASRIVSAKPSDALRANVMSRIAIEKPSRFAWRYVFAGGAIASVALVAFASLHNRAIPNPTISTPTLINPTVINPMASANPTAAGASASPLPSMVRTTADESGRMVFAADADQAGMSIPALEHPELMTPVKPLSEVAPIKAIDVEPISVAPLTVRAIDGDNQ